MEIVKKLHGSHSVRYSEIAVITPYRAQKELIREAMDKEKLKKNDQPSVITIMESQGTYSFCYTESLVTSALDVIINIVLFHYYLLVLDCIALWYQSQTL